MRNKKIFAGALAAVTALTIAQGAIAVAAE